MALVGLGWTAARLSVGPFTPVDPARPHNAAMLSELAATVARHASEPSVGIVKIAASKAIRHMAGRYREANPTFRTTALPVRVKRSRLIARAAPSPDGPLGAGPMPVTASVFPLATKSPAPPQKAHAKLVSTYAYSYWRAANGAGALASAGQYGGSQSGFIVTIDPALFSDKLELHRLSILVRAAVVPKRNARQEVAAGLRWQPLPHIPVSASVERRFFDDGGSRTAAYIAGGVDDVALPANIRVDAYGQAGFVTGAGAGGFYDVAAHAMRQVGSIGSIDIHAGAGVWSGGQSGAHRIDSGPSLRAKIPVGGKSIRIDADWRFRIEGNARPASGPALTLSTSF